MSRKESIYRIITNSEDLPSIPGLVVQLIHMTSDENDSIDIGELADLVGMDQTLAAKVVRWANSAHFSPVSPVTSIQRAVQLLGISTIRSMALGASVLQSMGNFGSNDIISADDFWIHSFRCAIAAKYLAEVFFYIDPSEAYLVGLLHDIGKVALIKSAYAIYLDVHMSCDEEDGSDLPEKEEDILGFTHADLSALLFVQWGLGEPLSEVVAAHHDPSVAQNTQKFPLAAILYLANTIADCDENFHAPAIFENLDPSALDEILEMDPSFDEWSLSDLIEDLLPEFEACIDVFQALI